MKNRDPYLKMAGMYDKFIEPQVAKLRKIGLKIYPARNNISILDVGCGTGNQLAVYRQPGCKLFGIDLSPAMLEVTRRKLGDAAELSLQDASHMNFADETFDLVTMMLVIHEMPASIRSAVLTECKRVLKKDGRLLVIDFSFGPYPLSSLFLRITRRFAEFTAGSEHYANYRDFKARKGMDPLIIEAGLSIDKKVVTRPGLHTIYLLMK